MTTTSPNGRLLSLSAGTVLDADPEEALAAAAEAGFDGFGVRWDPVSRPESALPALRSRIADHGMLLVDLEVIRLQPGVPVTRHRPWVEAASILGARFVLAVSSHPEPGVTQDELAQLAQWCGPKGPRVALEFMRFTSVPTFRSAVETVRAVEDDRLCVLVDALHVQRGGETPADLSNDHDVIGYWQLCDAPRTAPDPGALADEARHHRLFPGEGELPLVDLRDALPPGLTCCVEVQSDRWATTSPLVRARHAMQTTRTLLAAPSAGRPT